MAQGEQPAQATWDTGARPAPPQLADERVTLTGFLNFQRAALAWKYDGLTDNQLLQRCIPPSTISMLGLVRQMAEVERSSFRRVLGGEQAPLFYSATGDWDAAFDGADTADAAAAFATWRASCDDARAAVASAPSLDTTGERGGELFSLRWILTHMIEEYARHNGHADLLRERVDGSAGE
jgi:hypothetical protein